MRKNMGITLLIAILVLCAVYQERADVNEDVMAVMGEAPRPNFTAPAFELTGLDGKSYQVGGRRDKLLLINFWASWCGPCHIEAPDLQAIYTQYRAQLDLYAVNITFQDSQAGAIDFVSEYELTFPTLLDVTGEVTRKYRIDGYPTTFLINRGGVIVETYFGLAEKSELERDIKKWLVSGEVEGER